MCIIFVSAFESIFGILDTLWFQLIACFHFLSNSQALHKTRHQMKLQKLKKRIKWSCRCLLLFMVCIICVKGNSSQLASKSIASWSK